MIQVTQSIAISESEVRVKFVRSSGPGGQNVNKVSTAVQLRFDVLNSPSLPEDVRNRLLRTKKRVTRDGLLMLRAHRFRTQELNRKDAIGRFIATVRQAAQTPGPRIETRPSLASRKRRLEAKRRRSETKRMRNPTRLDAE